MSETPSDDYAACLQRLHLIDMPRCAAVLDLHRDGDALEIPFYDHVYRIASSRILDMNGDSPTDAVGLVLCKYLLNCPPQAVSSGERITFRELNGAGPLVSSFATNTNKLITGAFAGDVNALERASRKLNGAILADHPNYDLVIAFDALPRICVYLQFNAADEVFSAQCGLLFDQCAETYLDMQSLFILGTYLAGGLVRYQSQTASR